MFKKYGRRLRPRRKVSKPLYKRRSVIPRAVNRVAKRALSRQTETKTAIIQYDNQACNSGISVTGDFRELIPQITQGVTEGSRLGNRVNLKGIYVKGHIIASTIASTTSLVDKLAGNIPPNARIGVRMMVVAGRRYNEVNASTLSAYTDRLLSIGTLQTSFDGNVRDMYADIARDTVKVYYDKVFYINTPVMYNINTTAPAGTTSQDSVANVSGSCKFFKFKIPTKVAKLIYNDAIDYPLNFRPYLALGYCHLDGSTADVVTTAVKLSFVSKTYFTD